MEKATITLRGVELDIEFMYEPGQKEIRYDSNGTGTQGYPESIEIVNIFHNGTDFNDLLREDFDEEITELLMNLK